MSIASLEQQMPKSEDETMMQGLAQSEPTTANIVEEEGIAERQ
jgi:hypothetical protein